MVGIRFSVPSLTTEEWHQKVMGDFGHYALLLRRTMERVRHAQSVNIPFKETWAEVTETAYPFLYNFFWDGFTNDGSAYVALNTKLQQELSVMEMRVRLAKDRLEALNTPA